MIIIPRIVKNERVDDFLITQALESLSVSHPDGVFSALVPQVTCAPENFGCQQECVVEENEANCTCLNNYRPIGNGSVCEGK